MCGESRLTGSASASRWTARESSVADSIAQQFRDRVRGSHDAEVLQSCRGGAPLGGWSRHAIGLASPPPRAGTDRARMKNWTLGVLMIVRVAGPQRQNWEPLVEESRWIVLADLPHSCTPIGPARIGTRPDCGISSGIILRIFRSPL